MKRPMCPNCNVELEFVDCPDGEMREDFVVNNNYGECPQCKKVFKWEDFYKYSHWDNLEEVKED